MTHTVESKICLVITQKKFSTRCNRFLNKIWNINHLPEKAILATKNVTSLIHYNPMPGKKAIQLIQITTRTMLYHQTCIKPIT